MKLNPPAPQPQEDKEPETKDISRKLKMVRAGRSIASSVKSGNIEQAFAKTLVSGIKLADDNPFADPAANPLELLRALKTLGIGVLAWAPETLFGAIDKKFFGWTDAQAASALDHFHSTGILKTDVPHLVRQKIYAIRIVNTSDTAFNEWHIFEKVGAAFNDRVAHFGVVQKLTAGECARTLAIMDAIRTDELSREVRIYIAACAHEEGLISLAPSKWLRTANMELKQLNFEATGERLKPTVELEIGKKLELLKAVGGKIGHIDEDIITIQALKLLAIDLMGDEALI